MADDVSLRFSHLGGAPVVDLVNTVSWRLDPHRRSDKLQTFSDVVAWAAESGLIDDDDAGRLQRTAPATAERELARVIALREAVYDAGLLRSRDAADRIRVLAAAALRDAVASDLGDRWGWRFAPTPESVAHRLALEAAALLTSELASHIAQCSDDACGWVFLDTTPRRNRKWCSSADCGNRNRVRTHAARRRSRTDV